MRSSGMRSIIGMHRLITGGFSAARGITYTLKIPAIERYRWVSRRRLDADIQVLRSMTKRGFNAFGREDGQGKPHDAERDETPCDALCLISQAAMTDIQALIDFDEVLHG
jgi:hypothetical protein